MEWLTDLFSINTIMVTILGYPLSYLEAIAVIISIACIFLAAQANILNFFLGIICTSLYTLFFYQANLYSSMILQLVFIAFNIYGYFQWAAPNEAQTGDNEKLKVSRITVRTLFVSVIIIAVGTVLWGMAMANPPSIIANEFADAKYPYIDSFVMVASIVAQYLLAKKVLENWVIWLVVDVVAVGLYAASGAAFTAILYAVLVLIASHGLYTWYKLYKSNL